MTYRPRFYDNEERWAKVINALKGMGIEGAERLLFGDASKINGKARHEVKQDTKGDQVAVVSKSWRIKTLEDLTREARVNLDKYEVLAHTVNKWEGFYKKDDDTAEVVEMWQVKATFKQRKDTVEVLLRKVSEAIAEEARQAMKGVKLPPRHFIKSKGGLLVEPMITDHHIGKLCFEGDKVVWDKATAIDKYFDTIYAIIDDIGSREISQFVLPTGNDLINVDSQGNTTYAGTPQMSGELYEQIIIDTEAMLFSVINELARIAPVHVPMVPGNHDRATTFHVGRSCRHYFQNDDRVTITDGSKVRQYFKWNKVMLGFTHGDKSKLDRLPFHAATEEPQMWGTTVCREFHVGHFHHEKTAIHNSLNRDGMTVRICPTLCPPDRWHIDSGYVGSSKAVACYTFEPDRLAGVMFY